MKRKDFLKSLIGIGLLAPIIANAKEEKERFVPCLNAGCDDFWNKGVTPRGTLYPKVRPIEGDMYWDEKRKRYTIYINGEWVY